MDIFLYNTLTRKKEAFASLKKNAVGMYVCGPTVYWFAHIGNMRAYLFADILRRTLAYNGYQVHLIMNITDVGHLTDDEDAGEDKMILAMKREGKTAYEIADFYTQTFLRDCQRLHILPSDVYPRATAHVADQINMIQQIEQNGYTYTTSDGVYFDTSKLSDYGILSGQKAEEKMAGARVDMKEKKHPTDFALWKFSPTGTRREMKWESPWGTGFPGWHIECTAMSIKYLGLPFDIHTGGVDHIAVHHENELAQAVGCCGAYHARFWMHSEFLTVDGGKMSKSLGNLFTLEEVIAKGFDPIAFRYLTLGAHYRTKLNFTWEALAAAQNALTRLQTLVRDWDRPDEQFAQSYETRFREALCDDLNTPQALAVMWEMIEDHQIESAQKTQTLLKFDEVLGLGLNAYVGVPLVIPQEVYDLIDKRQQARNQKDWVASDIMRDQIESLGFSVEDTSNGPKIRQKTKLHGDTYRDLT